MKILDNNEQNFIGKVIRLTRGVDKITLRITDIMECMNPSSYSYCHTCSRQTIKGEIIDNTTRCNFIRWCLHDYEIIMD